MRSSLSKLILLAAAPLTLGLAQNAPPPSGCGQPLTPRADSMVIWLAASMDAGVPSSTYVTKRLQAAARTAPFSADGWDAFIRIAFWYDVVGTPALAIAREAARRWPQCPLARVAVADLELNRPRHGVRLRLEALRESFTQDAYLQAWIAKVYAHMANYAAAAHSFSRALALDSNVIVQHGEFWEAYEATAGVRHYLPPFKRPEGP